MSRTAQAFLYLIYFAILAVLGGFILHSFDNNSTTSKPAKPPVVARHAAPAQPAQPKTNSKSKPSAPKSSPTPSTQPNGLVNTGPGDLIILFATSTIIGTTIYQYKLRANP